MTHGDYSPKYEKGRAVAQPYESWLKSAR
ncbi:hypothetical protein FORC28_2508 [Escherichia coli]|nr:hypothetical protein FORC28_2508 [Escherichia coli]